MADRLYRYIVCFVLLASTFIFHWHKVFCQWVDIFIHFLLPSSTRLASDLHTIFIKKGKLVTGATAGYEVIASDDYSIKSFINQELCLSGGVFFPPLF